MMHNTDSSHFEFQRDAAFIHQRIARFPHHFTKNVCDVCGKHENELIGGGCCKAFDQHKLMLKSLQQQRILPRGDLVKLELSLMN